MDSLCQNRCCYFCRKYTKCPRIYMPNLSAQAQKFGISLKKRLHWASVVRVCKTLLMWCAKFNNGIFTTVARLGPSNPTLWYHFEKSRKSLTIYLLLTYTLGRHAILKKSKDWYFVTKIVLTYCCNGVAWFLFDEVMRLYFKFPYL